MEIGIIGLGRMGANIARRLMKAGHRCVVTTRDPAKVATLVAEGAVGAGDLDELVSKLSVPRAVWVMVPAGEITEKIVTAVAARCEAGDVIIDGGNSYFKDDVRRGNILREKGIHYMDVGTSGGVWGLERGYCLMIGGEKDAVNRLDPIFKALSPGQGSIPKTPGREPGSGTAEHGYLHCGPPGTGHFVKMIHNGIEYGLMQAFAEGFDIMRQASGEHVPEAQRFDLDVKEIAEVWRRGSVIGSWLLDLTAIALADDPELSGFEGIVHDSGEGRWTVMTAIEEAVEADVLTAALYRRFRSRQTHTFGEKILAAMRYQFGGHKE